MNREGNKSRNYDSFSSLALYPSCLDVFALAARGTKTENAREQVSENERKKLMTSRRYVAKQFEVICFVLLTTIRTLVFCYVSGNHVLVCGSSCFSLLGNHSMIVSKEPSLWYHPGSDRKPLDRKQNKRVNHFEVV